MKVFALSDPHLAFTTPNKSMDIFGEIWIDHPTKIKQNWIRHVGKDDIVIVPGDISWATKFEQALADLHWLHNLPGQKILLRGNHDLWWHKLKAMEEKLPSSLHLVQNNHVQLGPFVFFGSRLWDTEEYSFDDIILWDSKKGNLPYKKKGEDLINQEKIYHRELERLKLSINSLPKDSELIRIGLCHYPPLHHNLTESKAGKLFETAGAKHVVFGHLHSVKEPNVYGLARGTEYHLTSCDFINFVPKLICESE